MKKVLIIQKALPNYRIDFFNKLHDSLTKQNIELILLYGKRDKKNALKKDESDLDWAVKIKNHYIKIGSMSFIWQSGFKYLKGQNLIITEQANKLVFNYFIFFLRSFYHYKYAFWGHGQNQQSDRKSAGNLFKKRFINKVDWWFAYTKGVKEFLAKNNYPPQQITVVQNAVNTSKMRSILNSITEEETSSLIKKYNLEKRFVGVYCGGIYEEKRIDFLIQACDRIKERIPEFNFFIIGAGPESFKIEEACSIRKWMHYLGPLFEKNKIIYFKISSAFLMPGLVGLAVLDSFALKTPMITTNYPYHSPEIEYLNNNQNGLITENNISDYVNNCVNYLKDSNLQKKLFNGCEKSYEKYTLDSMVENFSNGIISCLND